MSGGFNNYSYDLIAPTRLNSLKQVLSKVKADLVSLIDTFRWDEIYTEDELKKMFRYKYVHCINLNDKRLKKIGHNNGITVLSNIEGVSFETIDLKTRNCVKTTLELKGVEYDIYSLYLDDLSEDVRLNQINQLAKNFKQNKPTIIIGDLNTISPKDSRESMQRVSAFLKDNHKYEAFKAQLEDMHRSEVTSKLFKLGFKDADIYSNTTFPTKLTSISDTPILRVDYCLYKSCDVEEFKVLFDDLLDKTSDHYPILVKL